MHKNYTPSVKLLAFLFLISFSHLSFSQRLSVFKVPKFKRDHTLNYIMGTVGIGAANYFGDLCSDYSCFTFRQSASIGAYWRYNERFAFRGEFFWTRLAGADKQYSNVYDDPRWGRDASFRTDIYELSIGATYDIFSFNPNYAKRSPVEPYLHASIGVLYFNPMGEYQGNWYNLHQFQTEGVNYSQVAMSFPIGAGCRFKITDKINLGVEIGYRITTTDYLDDVSTKYRMDVLKQTGAAGYFDGNNGYHTPNEVRGNPNNRDGYIVYSFKFEYLLLVTKQLHERGKNINSDIDSRYKKRQIRRR